jgi:asparagine synthase (glutamine-hydrolysing)
MGFVVLADTPEHSAVADSCLAQGWSCTTRHTSGRPWIVRTSRSRAPEQLVSAGSRRILAVGAVHTHDGAGVLERGLGQARTASDLVALRRHLSGDFHLFISTEDGTVQAGSISRTRRLCSTRLRGTGAVVFSDSASLLAELGGLPVDEQLVPVWALASYPPHPVDDLPLWRGVDAVPPGSFAALDRDGTLRLTSYWSPPTPEIGDAEQAADLVRTALSRAVEARSASFASVSADLSGGLDSTSLAFMLDRHTATFETFHSLSDDSLNDDARWAAVAAARLPGAEHHVFPYDESPTWYTMVEDRSYSRDTPDPMARTHGKSLYLHTRVDVAAGAVEPRVRGGDELFSMDVLAMHDYLTTDRGDAKKPFEAFVYERHDVPRTVRRRMAKDPDRDVSFEDWFARLGAATVSERRPWSLGWESTPRLAPWITDDARARLGDLFEGRGRSLGDLAPLSPRKPQHEIMKLVRIGGDVTRRMTALSAGHGVWVESPFLDEAVVEAALLAKPSVHIRTGTYKPLLGAAMRGILPPALAQRRSKGGYNRELYRGLEQNRPALLELFGQDSRAVARGIVDRASVVDALSGLPATVSTFMDLDVAIGLELWLRDVERPRYPSLQKELAR